MGGIAFIISLGLNSPFYAPLRTIVFPYRGLRAPARAAILLYLAIAALGAYGWARLMRGRGKVVQTVAAVLMGAALLIEYRTSMTKWLTLSEKPAEVYRWLATQRGRSLRMRSPVGQARQHPRRTHMFNSTWRSGRSSRLQRVLSEDVHGTSREHHIVPGRPLHHVLKQRGVDLPVIHGRLLGPKIFGNDRGAPCPQGRRHGSV